MEFEQVAASPGNRNTMATIGDVAKYAGVSRSTVSHALSGKRTISQATRERVNEAVRVDRKSVV